jgi:hypothetical protein
MKILVDKSNSKRLDILTQLAKNEKFIQKLNPTD